MPLVKKRKRILIILLSILALVSLSVFLLRSLHRPYVIAVVKKSQSETQSLNPTRLKAALSISWDDYWEEKGPRRNLELQYFTYNEEGPAHSTIEEELSEDRVIALIGDISSSTTQELAAIAHRMEIPHLSPIATDETIIEGHPWSFSPRTRLKHESQAIIEIIQNNLETHGLILLSTDMSGFKFRYNDFKERANRAGMDILLDLDIHTQQEDFSSIIEQIEKIPSHIPLVTFLSTSHTIDLYQQLKVMGLSHPKVSTAITMTQEIVPYLGEAGTGTYAPIISFYLEGEKDEKSSGFANTYGEILGTGRVDYSALSIYESLWVLLEVIEEVGQEPEKIRQGLLSYRGRPLVGYVSFNENGLLQENNHLVAQIRDGEIISK